MIPKFVSSVLILHTLLLINPTDYQTVSDYIPLYPDLRPANFSPSDCGKDRDKMERRYETQACFMHLKVEQFRQRNLEYEEVRRMSQDTFRRRRSASSSSLRIYGGNDTNSGQFPWTARLFYTRSNQTCTGSIVNEVFILTAAHCIHGRELELMKWFVGVDPPIADNQTEVTVVNYWTHPCWAGHAQPGGCSVESPVIYRNERLLPYDVGLVLIRNLTENGAWPMNNADPSNNFYKYNSICLSNNSWPVDMTEVYRMSGWGLMKHVTGTNPVRAERLQWFRLVVRGVIGNDTIILFHVRQRYAVCGGDSGSPIVARGADGLYYQRSVLCGGGRLFLCARRFAYSANIYQPEIRDWIWRTIRERMAGRN